MPNCKRSHKSSGRMRKHHIKELQKVVLEAKVVAKVVEE